MVLAWPSAIFWTMLCKSKGVFAEFVVGSMYLPLSKKLIVRVCSRVTLFRGEMLNTNVLALRIKFISPDIVA